MAYLHARQTRRRMDERLTVKWLLIRNLYHGGFTRQQVIDLIHFIDWVLHLPKKLDFRLREKIVAFEESQKMPYMSSIERIGLETGLQQGQAALLLQLLQERFGLLPEPVQQQVTAAKIDEIKVWASKIFKADSLQAVFR